MDHGGCKYKSVPDSMAAKLKSQKIKTYPNIKFSWNVLLWESKDIELASNNVGRTHKYQALHYLLIREPGRVINGKIA